MIGQEDQLKFVSNWILVMNFSPMLSFKSAFVWSRLRHHGNGKPINEMNKVRNDIEYNYQNMKRHSNYKIALCSSLIHLKFKWSSSRAFSSSKQLKSILSNENYAQQLMKSILSAQLVFWYEIILLAVYKFVYQYLFRSFGWSTSNLIKWDLIDFVCQSLTLYANDQTLKQLQAL